jgi:nucleoprotein TPR
MTSTRRKTKAAAAAAAVQQEAASARETSSPSTSPTFSLSLPSDIDVDALNALIPGESLDTPSEHAVLRLYRTLLAHATQVDATTREVEALRAEAEKKEVELDQAYQDRENDKRELENRINGLRKELRTVTTGRDELSMCSQGQVLIAIPLTSCGQCPRRVFFKKNFPLFQVPRARPSLNWIASSPALRM